jgi:hypothetical protein
MENDGETSGPNSSGVPRQYFGRICQKGFQLDGNYLFDVRNDPLQERNDHENSVARVSIA